MKSQLKLLHTEYDESIETLGHAIKTFNWKDHHTYACWLTQTNGIVRHTTTLLTMMATKFGAEDPAAHEYTLKHLREETGHDAMALKDVKMMGASAEDYPELVATALLYQTQYYWMERFGGNALCGYSLMLEGLSIKKGPWILEQTRSAFGEKACLFLTVHVREDPEHYASGLERLSKISQREIDVVLKNLRQSTELYQQFLHGITAYVKAMPELKKVA